MKAPSTQAVRIQELRAELSRHLDAVTAEIERLQGTEMTVMVPCPTCGTEGAWSRTVPEWASVQDRLFTLEDAAEALSRRAVKSAEGFLGQLGRRVKAQGVHGGGVGGRPLRRPASSLVTD